MKRHFQLLGALTALAASGAALAAGGDVGETAKQATNWTAISMFAIFVVATLWITKWAAAKTTSAADFYTAGGQGRTTGGERHQGAQDLEIAFHLVASSRMSLVRASYSLLARAT